MYFRPGNLRKKNNNNIHMVTNFKGFILLDFLVTIFVKGIHFINVGARKNKY